jgi:hypothetical protein
MKANSSFTEIKTYLKNIFKNVLSKNDKIELINRLVKWLGNESDIIKNNCWYCSKCKQWYDKKEFINKTKTRLIRNVLTFSDAGYGDDDRYGDVTYLVYYHECPYCHEETEDRKITLKIENERDRH